MAEGIELGKAYVQVVPSAEGISGKLSEQFGAEGASAGSMFSSMFGANLASKAVEVAASAAVALGKALADALGDVVEQYGTYEQLTGGVEKLFGDSSQLIYSYAEDAYTNAGISANEYMEQITSFSASLISSLDGDTKKAAKVGNQAIEDMSDNANTFGTDIASIQNAYQGFAKQNYTMLDNLKLGYGGTKEEMNRLIADANELKTANGEMADLTIDSYADIIEAIHLVQTEMGITGTTAEEASSTIEGSAASAEAAWSNVLTAMGDGNGDVKGAVKNWTDAVKTSVSNTYTVIDNTFKNIPTFVGGIFDALGEIINEHYVTVNGQTVATGDLIKANTKYYEEQKTFIEDTLTPLYENQSYVDQLTSLTDEYGNVAEENYGQVNALIEILNEKYGTQMSLQDGVISNYDTEISKIQETIDAELQEEYITQIMENKETALANLTEAAQAYSAQQEHVAQLEEQAAQYTDKTSDGYIALQEGISDAKEALGDCATAYSNAEIIATQALENWTLAQEGHADQAVFLNSEELTDITDTVDAIKTAYDDQIADYQTNIDEWTKIMKTQTGKAAANTQELINQEIAKKTAAEETRDAQIKAAEEANSKVQEKTAEMTAEQTAILQESKTNFAGAVNTQWEGVKTATEMNAKEVAEKAKGATNFDWSLPSLKMPHFWAEGQFSLNPLSIPTFGIDWYAKAMDEATVLNGATVFGSADGKLLGGGEVGSEVISGEDHLIKLINESVASVMSPALNQIVVLLDRYLPEAAKNDMKVMLDGDVLVGAITPKVDSELGKLNSRKVRGM